MRLSFHDPSGASAPVEPHAPRLPSLEGARIGFLSNEQWQAYRTLPLLKRLLEEDVPGADVLAIDAFPQGNAHIGSEETAPSSSGAASTPSSSATPPEGPAPPRAAGRPPGWKRRAFRR